MKSLKTVKILRPLYVGGRRLMRYVSKNSNWILSALAMLGVVGTAAEFTRATIKAVKLCEEKQAHGVKEVIKTVWELYIPGIGIALVTTIAIAGNARMNARRIAGISSLLAATNMDNRLLKEKAKEMLGEKKVEKLEDEVEREKVKQMTIPSEDQIHKTGHGNDLFIFGWNGQWFRACPDYIELVFREFNDLMAAEPDGVAYMHWLSEKFCLQKCDSDNCYYDMYDILHQGYKKVEADITDCQWMDVNGKQEMVCTLRCNPCPQWL